MLSIIITCYNNDWCVDKAIQSIKNIKYDNWECLIINDGSTDNSENVIKESIINDNRFKLITTENQGVAKARNLGMSLAKYDCCMFLDADDEILPDYPNNAIHYLIEHPECPLYFGGFLTVGMYNFPVKSKWVSYEDLLINQCIFTTAMFRKKHALDIGGFNSDLTAFENYEFWIRYLYHNSDNIKCADEFMVIYHTRPDSRHFSHTEKELSQNILQIQEMNKDIYIEYGKYKKGN